jgi:hypothetical protein
MAGGENWVTAKGSAPVPTVVTPPTAESFGAQIDPKNDEDYVKIIRTLQGYHADLLKTNDKLADNPVEAGIYQGKIRLEVNRLFAYINNYIDLQVDISEDYARERQTLYLAAIQSGKTPSAADKHAGEMTRLLANNEKTAQMRVKQIQNEYERYNGIAIYLATRMKEFNTERMVG